LSALITVTLLHDYDDVHFEVFVTRMLTSKFCDPSRYSLRIEREILSELENDWFPIYLFCNGNYTLFFFDCRMFCVNNATISSKISERERNNHVNADTFSPSGDSAMCWIVCLA